MVRRDRYGEPIDDDLILREWQGREAHARVVAHEALQGARAQLPERTRAPEHTQHREGLKSRLRASRGRR